MIALSFFPKTKNKNEEDDDRRLCNKNTGNDGHFEIGGMIFILSHRRWGSSGDAMLASGSCYYWWCRVGDGGRRDGDERRLGEELLSPELLLVAAVADDDGGGNTADEEDEEEDDRGDVDRSFRLLRQIGFAGSDVVTASIIIGRPVAAPDDPARFTRSITLTAVIFAVRATAVVAVTFTWTRKQITLRPRVTEPIPRRHAVIPTRPHQLRLHRHHQRCYEHPSHWCNHSVALLV